MKRINQIDNQNITDINPEYIFQKQERGKQIKHTIYQNFGTKQGGKQIKHTIYQNFGAKQGGKQIKHTIYQNFGTKQKH